MASHDEGWATSPPPASTSSLTRPAPEARQVQGCGVSPQAPPTPPQPLHPLPARQKILSGPTASLSPASGPVSHPPRGIRSRLGPRAAVSGSESSLGFIPGLCVPVCEVGVEPVGLWRSPLLSEARESRGQNLLPRNRAEFCRSSAPHPQAVPSQALSFLQATTDGPRDLF